jgi:hypothetical protein
MVDSGPGSTLLPVILVGLFVVTTPGPGVPGDAASLDRPFEFEAAIKVGSAAVFVVASVAAAAFGSGVTVLLAILWLKELMAVIAGFAVLRRDVGAPTAPVAAVWRGLLRGGFQITIASAGLLVMTRGPLFYLGNSVSDTAEIAHYSAVLRFADGAFLLSTAAGFALLPGWPSLRQASPSA